MALIDDLIRDEGFEGMPYKDSKGFDTIGIGCKLPLTRAEAILLANYRVSSTTSVLFHLMPWTTSLPAAWLEAMLNMAFNMGVEKLLGFHKMLAALKNGDGPTARAEALDSDWARELPERAERVVAAFAPAQAPQ